MIDHLCDPEMEELVQDPSRQQIDVLTRGKTQFVRFFLRLRGLRQRLHRDKHYCSKDLLFDFSQIFSELHPDESLLVCPVLRRVYESD